MRSTRSRKTWSRARSTASKLRCAIVLVSHRFALVEHADSIVVMRAGMTVEQSRFSELVKTGGLFASMHGSQAIERASAMGQR